MKYSISSGKMLNLSVVQSRNQILLEINLNMNGELNNNNNNNSNNFFKIKTLLY